MYTFLTPRLFGNRMFQTSVVILLSFLFVNNILQSDDAKERLTKAENFYKAAQFDNAIEILNQLSTDDAVDEEIQKDALRFLGRAYTAKGLYDDAKTAILKLLKLEPPMVMFNPDYEPPVFMKLYYESRKEFTGSYEVERPDPGMKTLAVIDFKNRSIDKKEQYDPMELGFADLVINRLNNTTTMKVIERERIKWILDEIKLQDEHNMEGAVRLGKQLGVQTVLMGSFIVVKGDIWLGARLVKVETSEILFSDEIKGDLDDFFELIDELSNKIAAKIDAELKEDIGEVVPEAPSLDAVMSYSIGLSYLEREDYKNAYAKFQEALKFDPNYEKAELKAQSIAPLL
ncbi:MAG: CsgG/HfaB family protein [Ignavibacteriaceae bacterium]